MLDTKQLLTVAHSFAELRRLKLSTVSSLALQDGKRLAALEDGADITTGRCRRTMQWFSDNWPDGPWPDEVPRPEPSLVGGRA